MSRDRLSYGGTSEDPAGASSHLNGQASIWTSWACRGRLQRHARRLLRSLPDEHTHCRRGNGERRSPRPDDDAGGRSQYLARQIREDDDEKKHAK